MLVLARVHGATHFIGGCKQCLLDAHNELPSILNCIMDDQIR
jgi:hypothetical protein